MTTLFDFTLSLANKITKALRGTATDGGTTTLTDSAMTFGNEFVGGTVWLRSGALAGTRRKVTSVNGSVIGFDELTQAVAAGVRYSAAIKDFSMGDLDAAVNDAAQALNAEVEEDLTLEVIENTQRYVLPDGVRNLVNDVEMAIQDAEPYGWRPVGGHWDEVNGELRFPPGFEPTWTGKKMRLSFLKPFEELTRDTDELPRSVDEELLMFQAIVEIMRGGLREYTTDDKRGLVSLYNEAQQELVRRRGSFNKPQRVSRPSDW